MPPAKTAKRKQQDKLTDRVKKFRKSNKLNLTCADCPTKSTPYVCMNFNSFICTECSGTHRKFSHRVKSIAVATFSEQEVDNLVEGGGNESVNGHYLAKYKKGQDSFSMPRENERERIEQFIKLKYVDRKWYREKLKKEKRKKPKKKKHSPKHEKVEEPKEVPVKKVEPKPQPVQQTKEINLLDDFNFGGDTQPVTPNGTSQVKEDPVFGNNDWDPWTSSNDTQNVSTQQQTTSQVPTTTTTTTSTGGWDDDLFGNSTTTSSTTTSQSQPQKQTQPNNTFTSFNQPMSGFGNQPQQTFGYNQPMQNPMYNQPQQNTGFGYNQPMQMQPNYGGFNQGQGMQMPQQQPQVQQNSSFLGILNSVNQEKQREEERKRQEELERQRKEQLEQQKQKQQQQQMQQQQDTQPVGDLFGDLVNEFNLNSPPPKTNSGNNSSSSMQPSTNPMTSTMTNPMTSNYYGNTMPNTNPMVNPINTSMTYGYNTQPISNTRTTPTPNTQQNIGYGYNPNQPQPQQQMNYGYNVPVQQTQQNTWNPNMYTSNVTTTSSGGGGNNPFR